MKAGRLNPGLRRGVYSKKTFEELRAGCRNGPLMVEMKGAENNGASESAISPIVVLGLALFLGMLLARWIDWTDRARTGI
jgi:hypothetical protein